LEALPKVIYTKQQFLDALERLRNHYRAQQVTTAQDLGYKMGYIRAIDDVMTLITAEGGCFVE